MKALLATVFHPRVSPFIETDWLNKWCLGFVGLWVVFCFVCFCVSVLFAFWCWVTCPCQSLLVLQQVVPLV